MDEKIGNGELEAAASCSSSAIPCLDKLREELSCAVSVDCLFSCSNIMFSVSTFCFGFLLGSNNLADLFGDML